MNTPTSRQMTRNPRVPDKARKRRKKIIALIVGMVLALACKSLPQEYHVACDTVVKLCTGGAL